MKDHDQPSPDWLAEIHRAFARESDRAAAIVAAAMLDELLKALLKKRLVSPASAERSIIDRQDGPLATFSARIDAAFQLGLISRFLARDVHLIRKIRNEFAHHPLERTFDSPPIVDWVRALEAASDYNRRRPDIRRDVGPPGTRWDFLGIAAWILYHLDREHEVIKTIRDHGPEFGYIDWSQLAPEIQWLLDEKGAA